MKKKPSDKLAHWKNSTGKTAYARYLNGGRLSRAKALEAKCAECTNGYADGRVDCLLPACPLYPFMPYRAGGPQKSGTRKRSGGAA